MVEAEVQSAIKKNESQLDALINTIQQQLDQQATLQILESRMLAVAEKAEKALVHFNETQTPPPLSPIPNFQDATPPYLAPAAPVADSRSDLEVKNVKSLSQTSLGLEEQSVSEFMENTKKQFQLLRAENAALKAAFEDIRERATPSPTNVRQQSGVLEGLAKLMHIKKEPVDSQVTALSPASGAAKRPKQELVSPEAERIAKRIKSDPVSDAQASPAQASPARVTLPYPALPPLPFPASLPPESALYTLPNRVTVNLALVKKPSPQLSVVWSLEDRNPREPPMASYSILFTTEQVVGSGTFKEWQVLEECSADRSYVLYPLSRPVQKICVSVVGKDKFGRYGPFSQVAYAVCM